MKMNDDCLDLSNKVNFSKETLNYANEFLLLFGSCDSMISLFKYFHFPHVLKLMLQILTTVLIF